MTINKKKKAIYVTTEEIIELEESGILDEMRINPKYKGYVFYNNDDGEYDSIEGAIEFNYTKNAQINHLTQAQRKSII